MDFASRSASDHTPERQLWCAVVGRALEDALGNPGGISGSFAQHRAVIEARDWFEENGLDFRRACEAAGFEPDLLRHRALRLIAERGAKPSWHELARADDKLPDEVPGLANP